MNTHPSSLDLEAFACGEPIALVDAHVGICDECRAFVAKLANGAKAFAASLEDGLEAMLRKAEARIATEPASPKSNVVSLEAKRDRKHATLFTLLPLVAVAAGVIVWIVLPSLTTPRQIGLNTPPARTGVIDPSVPTTEPETTFKGGVQVAVVRDRDGHQDRFTSRVVIRPGDRLRIEVALDHPEAILAGVLAEDGTFLTIMAEGTRGQGTHFSEQAARFDDEPTRGWILVGPADAIERAKSARAPVRGVTSMRVEWEPR